MVVSVFGIVVGLWLGPPEPELREYFDLTPAQFKAELRRLAGFKGGCNAADEYVRGFRDFRWPSGIPWLNQTDEQRKLTAWFDNNDYALMRRFDWPAEAKSCWHQNCGVPGEIHWAPNSNQCFVTPIDEADPNDVFRWVDQRSAMRGAARVLAINAAYLASEGNWYEAYPENALLFHIAGQGRRSGSIIDWMTADAIEDLGLKQLKAMVAARPPTSIEEMAEEIEWQRNIGSVAARDWIASAEQWESIRRTFVWLQNAADEPDLWEVLEGAIYYGHDRDPPKRGRLTQVRNSAPPIFGTPEELRVCAATANPARARAVVGCMDELLADWERLPLHEALRTLKSFRAAYDAEAAADPVVQFWNDNRVLRPGGERIMFAKNRQFEAMVVVYAGIYQYQVRTGEWPASLSALRPELRERAVDLYSGEPLRYARSEDGKTFKLWSVDEDQRDDGGDDGKDWVWGPYEPPKFEEVKGS